MKEVYMYSTLLVSFQDGDEDSFTKVYIYRNMKGEVYTEFVREWVYGPAPTDQIVGYIRDQISEEMADKVLSFFSEERREQDCD